MASNEDPSHFTQKIADEKPESVWQQNGGNTILAFALALLLIGSGVLAFRQFRFVAPRFPDAKTFPADRNAVTDDEQDPALQEKEPSSEGLPTDSPDESENAKDKEQRSD